MSATSSTMLSTPVDGSQKHAANSTFGSSGAGSEHGSNSSHDSGSGDDHVGPPSKRAKITAGNPSSDMVPLEFAELHGQCFYVGDHVLLDDIENASGTRGTGLPAVGHIQQLDRNTRAGLVSVSVVWYIFPQLTPHPPLMEFYQNALLRTLRQTTVPLEHLKRTCFVVQPAEAMIGHPAEYTEDSGLPLFVCDSRYNDKGGFIKMIKHRNHGYWPASMDEKRQSMLTTMVPWPSGLRELEKSLVPVRASSENKPDSMLHTVWASNITAPPNVVPIAAIPPSQQQDIASHLAYQQMPLQGQASATMPPLTPSEQPHPPLEANGTGHEQATLPPKELQQQQQQNTDGQADANATRTITNSEVSQAPSPGSHAFAFPTSPPPRKRGRPPKNKQLIEQQAMENAAKAADATTPVQSPGTQLRSSTRLQAAASLSNGSRLLAPLSPAALSGVNGVLNSHAGSNQLVVPRSTNAVQSSANFSPAQLLAARVQPGLAAAPTQQQQQYIQQQKQYQNQLQQRQMLMQQQQLVSSAQVTSLSHAGLDPAPQLPKDVVDLFAAANGKVRWSATPPVCRTPDSKAIQHSAVYIKWKQDHSETCANDDPSS